MGRVSGGGGGGGGVPASATGAFRAEHLIVSGTEVTGVNDQAGDGSWFIPVNNPQGDTTNGIDTAQYLATGRRVDFEGIDGTSNVALRIRETGGAFSSGIMFARNAAYLGGFENGNTSAYASGFTSGSFFVEETELTSPNWDVLWDTLAIDTANPTSRNVCAMSLDVNTGTNAAPCWYESAGLVPKLYIEAAVIFTDAADRAAAYTWMEG